MSIYCIYELRCPRSGKPRYVGKTAIPITRLLQHLRGEDRTTRGWIANLRKRGVAPIFIPVAYRLRPGRAKRYELDHIRKLIRGGAKLLNSQAVGPKTRGRMREIGSIASKLVECDDAKIRIKLLEEFEKRIRLNEYLNCMRKKR